MNKLREKIKNHPRSQAARAYRLGQAEADALLPLAKLSIRYFMLKDRGFLRSKKESRELVKVRANLDTLTKAK